MALKRVKSGKGKAKNAAATQKRTTSIDPSPKSKKAVPKKKQSKKQQIHSADEESMQHETSSSSSPEEETSDDSSSDEEESDKDNRGSNPTKESKTTKLGKKKVEESSSEEESSEESSDDDDDEDESDSQDKNGGFFTDENARWLKPKKQEKEKAQLMSSSSDEEDGEDVNDEFDDQVGADDDDDEEGMLEVERQSRLIDAEMKAEREEAEEELRRTIAQNTEVFHLPTVEELEQDENRVVPPSEIRARIESILEVLADFKSRREPGRSRSEYVDQLVSDIAELHGYLPELIEYFVSMFGPSETLEFVDASDKPRPLVVRTNTLKARRKDLASALMKRGVTLDPLASWSKVGLKIMESPVPVGATPEYLSGMYMLQSAASMCPVMALSPQPNEKVLDMSAAPGGKTSYIAQLMKNTGVIIANDLKADRQKATVANMHRLGVRNVVACTHDGRKLGQKFHSSFDRILLDAPCSGLGVISRDPSVKVQRTMADVKRTCHLQKELLLAAIDALNHKSKTGAVMVYSTCSVSVAENEEVVNYALSKRDIKIVDAGLDFGKPGFTRYQQKRFHPSLALTRRFYPHVHNMDGFYVAKIQKLSARRPEDSLEEEENKAAENQLEPTAVDAEDGGTKEKHSSKKRGKKRGAERAESEKVKKSKDSHMSVPPVMRQQKKKKKKANAKVTKPRRKKIEVSM